MARCLLNGRDVWTQPKAKLAGAANAAEIATETRADLGVAPAAPASDFRGPGGGDPALLVETFAHYADVGLTRQPRRAEVLARAEATFARAVDTSTAVSTGLAPGYVAARDALDGAAVLELGGRLIAALSFVHAARRAIDRLVGDAPRQCVVGEALDESEQAARVEAALATKRPTLEPLVASVEDTVAATLLVHRFRGREVAPAPLTLELDGQSDAHRVSRLADELRRTAAMLDLVGTVGRELSEAKRPARETLESARRKVGAFASRPVDLAFLRAALGPLWDLLDATAEGPLDRKPSEMLAGAEKQAEHTGWLGDVGQFHTSTAIGLLQPGAGRAQAELVLADLYSADPDTRARLLEKLGELGLLSNLCSAVGWADVKDLHDSLGQGFGDVKTQLQRHFLGPGKWGPDLQREWESHDGSAHSLLARLGPLGGAMNFVLDAGSFGFYSSYSRAIDGERQGRMSAGEAARARQHAAGAAIATGAIALATGGLADKLVRGGAATVSVARGAAAGATGGAVGAVTGLGAQDAYGNFVSGDRQGISSLEDYALAALLGGAVGGALGGALQGLSNRAARYATRGQVDDGAPGTTPGTTPETRIDDLPPVAGTPIDAATRLAHLEGSGLVSMVGDHLFLGTPEQVAAAVAALRRAGVDARVAGTSNRVSTVRIGDGEIHVHLQEPAVTPGMGDELFDPSPPRMAPGMFDAPPAQARTPELPVSIKDVLAEPLGPPHPDFFELGFVAKVPGGQVTLGTADGWAPGATNASPASMTLFGHKIWNGKLYRFRIYEEVTPVAGSEIPAGVGQPISLTDWALRKLIEFHRQRYGVDPEAVGGYLAGDNLRNFQREYVKARATVNSESEALDKAIKAVSFGRARVAERYTELTFNADLRYELVDLGPELGKQVVPVNVSPTARRP